VYRTPIVRIKTGSDSADPGRVTTFSDGVWVLLGLITLFGVSQILRAMAMRVRNGTALHDLRVGVAELQIEHFHQIMLKHRIPRRDETPGEVEVLEDEPVEAAEEVETRKAA
jgi:hypothetical protein